jgi:hypothetical protein
VTWRAVVRAARAVRDVLDVLGLASWVKTTGGRGLHVVVPITPARNWSECLNFSRAVAYVLVRSSPATLHHRLREVGPRIEDPHRLLTQQPDEYVNRRVLYTRQTGRDRVGASDLARVGSGAAGDVDRENCYEPNEAVASGSVARLLDESPTH